MLIHFAELIFVAHIISSKNTQGLLKKATYNENTSIIDHSIQTESNAGNKSRYLMCN